MNYTFIFLPAVILLVNGRLHKPAGWLLLAMIFYALVFYAATAYQYEFWSEWPRRTSSFVLFMTMFVFLFVQVDDEMIRAFKVAVVSISVAFSLWSAYVYLAQGGAQLGFGAKSVVGSQRFGFVYLLALWIAYRSAPRFLVLRFAKLGVIVVVLIGLALTFSRASIAALAASAFLFFIWSVFRHLRLASARQFARSFFGAIAVCAGLLILTVVIQTYFSVLPKFFDAALFGLVRDRDTLVSQINSNISSEGMRLVIWREIFGYVIANPLTGAGFLGVWILESVVASAHNQYMDVLFRAGFAGLIVYLAILFGIARKLRARGEYGLYWGFVAMLFYGLFHETFKESQGAFALAFLLGIPNPGNRSYY